MLSKVEQLMLEVFDIQKHFEKNLFVQGTLSRSSGSAGASISIRKVEKKFKDIYKLLHYDITDKDLFNLAQVPPYKSGNRTFDAGDAHLY